MLKFRINKFLELRFEDGETNIYVNNILVNHCKYILINVQVDCSKDITEINSIDEVNNQSRNAIISNTNPFSSILS